MQEKVIDSQAWQAICAVQDQSISLLSAVNPQREYSYCAFPFPYQKAPHHWRNGAQTSLLKETLPHILTLHVSIYPHLATIFSFVVSSMIYCPLLKWYISSYICWLLPHFCGTCIKIVKWPIYLSFSSVVS